MASFNRVILMGHLVRDPEVRTLPNSQTSVCEFSLAVNRRWKDGEGNEREELLFVDCCAFNGVGTAIGQYLAKGRPVHIEGRLRLDQWEKDGERRSKLRVVVESFQFCDRKPEGDSGAADSRRGGKKGKGTRSPAAPPPPPVDAENIPY